MVPSTNSLIADYCGVCSGAAMNSNSGKASATSSKENASRALQTQSTCDPERVPMYQHVPSMSAEGTHSENKDGWPSSTLTSARFPPIQRIYFKYLQVLIPHVWFEPTKMNLVHFRHHHDPIPRHAPTAPDSHQACGTSSCFHSAHAPLVKSMASMAQQLAAGGQK